MGYRLLLDENVEREGSDRLTALGHDVERVETVDSLGRGTPDDILAQYSRREERAILTHDDDFVAASHDAHVVLFVADESMTAADLATVVDRMADIYPCEELDGVQRVGREWL